MRAVAIILALVCAVAAIIYWVVPAGSLPSFAPGFEAGSARVHLKHGFAAGVAALVFLAIAWYAGRSRA